MDALPYKAAIFDLDGVITHTAHLHARAWKQMFDAYLARRSERQGVPHEPFDLPDDYVRYVDGKPRYDGVRSFLASRNVELPEGTPDDPPEAETVCGLGNRKNTLFHDLLQEEGVEPYDDAIEALTRWQRQGLKTALITSSRNGMAILEAADLNDRFDAIVDGVESASLDIEGKPAPDIFLEAARRLGVAPEEVIVLEDALAGVEAGRAGGFGLVVGVARDGAEALRAHGADVVVRDLRALDLFRAAQEGGHPS